MALNDAALKSGLEALLNASGNPTASTQADGLAALIEAYVKSATVNVPAAGLAAPNGPVTGSASGTLS